MNSILTNTAASSAQRFLGQASGAASSSISKMSSGSRIVKASDDAASLAISNKLRADIATLNQASRNASQGSSLLQVANGGLSQVGDLLTRMKTLSTQVVNGTLSSSERQFAQQEFDQLITQIGETAAQTQVNGIAMLNGGNKGVAVSNSVTLAGAAITSSVNGIKTAASDGGAIFNDGNATIVDDIRGRVEGSVENVTAVDVDGSSEIEVTVTIGGQEFKGTVVADSADGTDVEFTMTSTTNSNNSFTLTADDGDAITAADMQTALRDVFQLDETGTAPAVFKAAEEAEAAGKALISAAGTTYADVISGSGATEDGKYTLTSRFTAGANGAPEYVTLRLEHEDGSVYEATIDDEVSGTDNSLVAGNKTVKFGNGLEVSFDAAAINSLAQAGQAGSLGYADDRSVAFEITAGTATSLDFQVGVSSADVISINFDSMSTASLGVAGLNIETVAGAQAASVAIDEAINKVNTSVAQVGALQSRMEYVQSNLATVTENVEAANGIFKDVDMAKEMTEFTKQQSLMQAGISMLSQANQMPQLLLRLIG